MTKDRMINGKNYFNEESLAEMVKQLERGEVISIYIDCIGHTRTAYETSLYVKALQERFGERLIIDDKSSWCTTYKLS